MHEILHKDIGKHELRFALGIPGSVALRQLGITDTEHANSRWNEHLLKYNYRMSAQPLPIGASGIGIDVTKITLLL